MPLDIGVGILLSLGVAHWFSVPVTPLLVIVGILSTLAPDIDMFFPLLGNTKHNHRSFTHYPLTFVPIVVVAFLLLNQVYATLIALGIVAHFIHDTIGIGWGIKWAAPFSMRAYLLPNKSRRRDYGWFMSWLPQEESAMAEKYHDPHWIRTYYFRPNAIAYVEYGVLCISLFVLVWVQYLD